MPCTFWRAQELLTRAELLASVLYQRDIITGVALTGSVPRLEQHVHDLDLVVLHNAGPDDMDGSASVPLSHSLSGESHPKKLTELLQSPHLAAHVDLARGPVPINIVFVSDRVLRDCEYLNRINQGGSPDFFKTVFCEIPLWLLMPQKAHDHVSSAIRDYARRTATDASGLTIPYREVRHRCTNGCAPQVSWTERRTAYRRERKQDCILND